MSDEREAGRRNLWTRLGQLTAVAWEFLGGIIAGALLGYFVDRHFESDPWGLIGCTLLGTCTGLFRMVVTLKQLERRSSHE